MTNVTLALTPPFFVTKNHRPFLVKNGLFRRWKFLTILIFQSPQSVLENFLAKISFPEPLRANSWQLRVWPPPYPYKIEVLKSALNGFTRQSILGYDGMTKSDCSLSLWLLCKDPLSAFWVLWVLSECLLIALSVNLKSSWNSMIPLSMLNINLSLIGEN